MIDYDELLAYTIAFKRDYLPQKDSKMFLDWKVGKNTSGEIVELVM